MKGTGNILYFFFPTFTTENLIKQYTDMEALCCFKKHTAERPNCILWETF